MNEVFKRHFSSTPTVKIANTLLIAFCAMFFTSCLGPKKINKWVNFQYDGTIPQAPKKKADYLTVVSTMPDMGTTLSATQKKTSKVLPLIFYWQFDYKNTCTLNPAIPIAKFSSAVSTYGNKELKPKLAGQHLELTIEKIPSRFSIDDFGHMIWVIYAFGWDDLSIQPEDKEMVVSYKVMKDDNVVIKSGSITVKNNDKGVALGMFQSTRKRTLQYLDDYEANIAKMSKDFVDKLVTEL